MTLKRNNAEGYSNGASVTGGTSGGASGDSVLVAGTAGVFTAANTHPAHGSMGYKATLAANNTGTLLYQGYTVNSMAASVSVYLPTLPGISENILTFFNSSSGAVARLEVQPNGTVKLFIPGSVNAWTSTAVLAASTMYRIEMWGTIGTATTGELHIAIYTGNSTTPIGGSTYDTTSINIGTTTIGSAQFGRAYSNSGSYTYYMDDLSADDGRTSFIGPAPSGVPPTVNAGLDQTVEPFSTVTLSATGTPYSGATVSSFFWTQLSGTPTVTLSGSGASRTFTAPASQAGNTLVFSVTCTDSNNSTSTQDPVTVTVLPATEFYLSSGGSWRPLQIVAL